MWTLSISKSLCMTVVAIASFALSALIINGHVRPDAHKKWIYAVRFDADSIRFNMMYDSSKQITIAQEKTNLKGLRPDKLIYNLNPKVLNWLIFFAILFSISVTLFILGIGFSADLIREFRIGVKVIWIVIIVILACVGVLTFGGTITGRLFAAFPIMVYFGILLSSVNPIIWLMIAIAISGGTALFGMILTNFAIGNDLTIKRKTVAKLSVALNFFLTYASVIIMLTVATTGLLQQAIESVLSIQGVKIFPTELVYAYGLIFTMLLTAIYLPVHFRLRIISLKFDRDNSKKDQSTLIPTAQKSFQMIFTLLGPLLGSVLSEVIGYAF
jgi:hypothetical protein